MDCAGSGKPPKATVLGMEFGEGYFPDDVTGVVDRHGQPWLRGKGGWYLVSDGERYTGMFRMGPEIGPYMVIQVNRGERLGL